jgi:hypothetical protein
MKKANAMRGEALNHSLRQKLSMNLQRRPMKQQEITVNRNAQRHRSPKKCHPKQSGVFFLCSLLPVVSLVLRDPVRQKTPQPSVSFLRAHHLPAKTVSSDLREAAIFSFLRR